MMAKRDDCASIEELIHLSIDGELSGEENRRLERHLAACARCAEKLDRMRAADARARSIGLDEPPPEYWSAFSGRVIERIENGAEKKPAWSPARVFGGLLAGARPRLRLAAGIVSIAVVVFAGALYLRDRDGIVPSAPARNETEEASRAPMQKEPAVESAVEPKTETSARSKSAPPPAEAPARAEAPSTAAEAPPAVAEAQGTTAPASSEGAGAPTAAAADASSAVVVDAFVPSRIESSAAPAGELAMIDALAPVKAPAVSVRSSDQSAFTAQLKAGTAASGSKKSGYTLDGETVPLVSAADTSMSEDTLRRVIDRWRSHIALDPLDPRNNLGYVQAANACYLLARLTRDEAVISQGARLVQEYADRADDPALKTLLLDSKARIESLRGK